jgi:hypothetical protein
VLRIHEARDPEEGIAKHRVGFSIRAWAISDVSPLSSSTPCISKTGRHRSSIIGSVKTLVVTPILNLDTPGPSSIRYIFTDFPTALTGTSAAVLEQERERSPYPTTGILESRRRVFFGAFLGLHRATASTKALSELSAAWKRS